MTIVLGGGMSGLSAAYYALKNPKLGSLTVLEASNRLGGWVRSHELPNGIIFEKGPRTIRCSDAAGKNTLNLVEDLQLADKVIPIKEDHPTVKYRMIYARNSLHLLPNSTKGLIEPNSLIKRPLATALLRDWNKPRILKDDESVYSFTERRLGKNIADYFISPIICGICAGDAKEISVNFLMKPLFEAEQRYGSISRGVFFNFFKKKFYMSELPNLKLSDLAKKANSEKWVLWGLKGGLEQLPQSLGRHLNNQGVDIQLNSSCEKLLFNSNHVELTVNGEVKKCSRIISSLPAKTLAKLIEEQHPELATLLSEIPMVTVGVVNLQFEGKIMPLDAFGFLIPPKENIPILGVIYDSCVFPQDSSTVLTVMMGGAWFEQYFGKNPSNGQLLDVATKEVKSILKVKKDPIGYNVAILKDCIPQHVVGHSQRLNSIRDYISSHNIPLGLCGSSYQGVGINDVILSAKQAVSEIAQESNKSKN